VAVLGEALHHYLGFDPEAPRAGLTAAVTVPAGTPALPVAAEDLAQYAGHYVVPDATYSLRATDDGLRLTVEDHPAPDQIRGNIESPPVRDAPVPFVATDLALLGSTVHPFVRKPNGDVGWFSVGLRLLPRTGPA
jgi:hypothetical protein